MKCHGGIQIKCSRCSNIVFAQPSTLYMLPHKKQDVKENMLNLFNQGSILTFIYIISLWRPEPAHCPTVILPFLQAL